MRFIGRFLVRSFALLGLLVFLVSAAGWWTLLSHKAPKLPEAIVLRADFTKPINESAARSPLQRVLGDEEKLGLQDTVAALELAGKDTRVKVVTATFRDDPGGLAAMQEVREALLRLPQPSYAFATSFGEVGPANKAYFLASAFDQIWLQPGGLVGLNGLAIEMPFAKGTLDKLGVTADFTARAEYKTAMHSFTETGFTPANEEMLTSLAGDLYAQLTGEIAAARGLTPEAVGQAMDNAPLLADEARDAQLVDRLGYEDEMMQAAIAKAGTHAGKDAETVTLADYLAMRRRELREADKQQKVKNRPTIAYLHFTGQIVPHMSGGVSDGTDMLDADKAVDAIRDAVADKDVEALLVRLDSPGGSAVASDTIARALDVAQDRGLPVIVSMGGLAGSGAYWLAADADQIFADPATLTGSIGVLAGKFADAGLLDKAGVNLQGIATNALGDMWSVSAPFDSAQRAKLDHVVDQLYADFKARVAAGRDLTPEAVETLARGRVWTGAQALELGLVDEVGGLQEATAYTKSLLGVPEDMLVPIKSFPEKESLQKRLTLLLDRLATMGAGMAELSASLGRWLEAVQPLLNSAMPVSGGRAAMPVGLSAP